MRIPESTLLPLFEKENERLRPSGRQLKIHPSNIYEDIALGRSVTQSREKIERRKRNDGYKLKPKRTLNLHLLVILVLLYINFFKFAFLLK